MRIISYSHITNGRCLVNGNELPIERSTDSYLTDIYRSLQVGYPKFFKMDNLCKAGFLASEVLLQVSDIDRVTPRHDISIVCANSSSSLDDDITYQQTIQHSDNYFPSPSVFVYTLANIVTGEIAIRNKILGESSFYVFKKFSAQHIEELIKGAFLDNEINYLICGWTEVLRDSVDVFMMYVSRNSVEGLDLSIDIINNLYNR